MSETSVTEAYKVLQAACGIEVGDKVRVLRAHRTHELGYAYETSASKERLVGKTGIATRIDSDSVMIDFGDTSYRYGWPFFCLELVEKAKPKLPPIMVGNHEVEFLDGKIKVCDVAVPKETLQKILERLEN